MTATTLPTLTNAQQAQLTAATRAADTLTGIDLVARCQILSLPLPSPDGSLTIRILGRNIRLTPPDFAAAPAPSTVTAQACRVADHSQTAGPLDPKPVSPAERLLSLHYLLCQTSVKPTGEMISFRDLPGGNFYFGPFSNRTTRPLAQRIANDLPRLQQNLARFDTTPAAGFPSADLAVRIHIIGPLHLTLLYHVGDDEAPASAEILFDQAIKRVYNTEDVAVLSSRICFTLIN